MRLIVRGMRLIVRGAYKMQINDSRLAVGRLSTGL